MRPALACSCSADAFIVTPVVCRRTHSCNRVVPDAYPTSRYLSARSYAADLLAPGGKRRRISNLTSGSPCTLVSLNPTTNADTPFPAASRRHSSTFSVMRSMARACTTGDLEIGHISRVILQIRAARAARLSRRVSTNRAYEFIDTITSARTKLTARRAEFSDARTIADIRRAGSGTKLILLQHAGLPSSRVRGRPECPGLRRLGHARGWHHRQPSLGGWPVTVRPLCTGNAVTIGCRSNRDRTHAGPSDRRFPSLARRQGHVAATDACEL